MTKDSATKIWGSSLSSEAVKSIAPYPFMYAASDLYVCVCVRNGWLTKIPVEIWKTYHMNYICLSYPNWCGFWLTILTSCVFHHQKDPKNNQKNLKINKKNKMLISIIIIKILLIILHQQSTQGLIKGNTRFSGIETLLDSHGTEKNIGFEFHFQTEISSFSRCFALV